MFNSIDKLQLWLQIKEQYTDKDIHSYELTLEERIQLDKINTKKLKPLKGEYEIFDILSSCGYDSESETIDEEDCKIGISWGYITISDFKTRWDDILRPYNVRVISLVLDRLGLTLDKFGKKERGNKKLRYLPH